MNNQVNMSILGVPVLSEEHLKLIKKVCVLTGKPQDELTSLTIEELNLIVEDDKKVKENNKKILKAVKALKKLFINEKIVYDDKLTYDENKVIYDAFIDKKNNPSFIYPFRIYFKGCDIQEPDHIFEFNKAYTTKEISKMLFKSGYREFAGKVTLNYDEEDNMLVPEFTSQRHG